MCGWRGEAQQSSVGLMAPGAKGMQAGLLIINMHFLNQTTQSLLNRDRMIKTHHHDFQKGLDYVMRLTVPGPRKTAVLTQAGLVCKV